MAAYSTAAFALLSRRCRDACGLPKTSTGEIQKYVLRERGWAGYRKRVN